MKRENRATETMPALSSGACAYQERTRPGTQHLTGVWFDGPQGSAIIAPSPA
jgi:hypothetical protein